MSSEKEKIYLEYLVLHCQHRDSAAWEELVGLYEKRLYYFLRQLVQSHEEALNLLQDTWLKAYRSIHRLREPAAIGAWLYRIARNAALKSRHARRGEVLLQESAAEILAEDDYPEEMYSAEEVHRGLQLLSEAHREVLVLFYLENFSLQQAADILNIPIGTVRSRLHFAKINLKSKLEKEIIHECERKLSR